MRDFKFLSKNDTINFNGQMSIEALRYFNDYINRIVRYEITTTTATYKIADYTYGEGNVVAGTVNAYPLDASNIMVTYTTFRSRDTICIFNHAFLELLRTQSLYLFIW